MTVYVIAEAGVNHCGDLARALDMVDAAAGAGADAVKFQTFRPAALVTADARQADYQVRNGGDAGSQLAMLERLVLGPEAHYALLERCQARGIDFMSSPFDSASAAFLLEDLDLARIKIGSGELTNAPLLIQVARADRQMIVSTGMATLAEVREALGAIAFGLLSDRDPVTRSDLVAALADPSAASRLGERVTLLHCTTEYPCPPEHVNLRAMETLADAFGLPVGYSDHTLGIAISVAAAARGAAILEKHFTLNRTLPGPDHAASIEPDELAALVSAVRAVSRALGSAEKVPAPAEAGNATVARKSLATASVVRAGERFDPTNLTVKRPGTGRSPCDYWDVLGTPASRDYSPDEVIE